MLGVKPTQSIGVIAGDCMCDVVNLGQMNRKHIVMSGHRLRWGYKIIQPEKTNIAAAQSGFFMEFTQDGFDEPLTRFDLATRERVVASRRTLSAAHQKEFVLPHDNTRHSHSGIMRD